MNLSKNELWIRFQQYYTEFTSIGLWIDLSRMNFAEDFFQRNDRLELFSRYLQQLIMESLGKQPDLAGNIVRQSLTVFRNKGYS